MKKRLTRSVLLCLMLATNAPAYAGFAAQALRDDVHALVTAAVSRQYPQAQLDVQIQTFHQAVLNKSCAAFSLQIKGNRLYGRIPVMARCTDPQPWTFYVSAQVDVQIPVVVSQRAITSGERISKEMLTVSWQSMSSLRGQYVSTDDELLGKVAKRAIRAQQPVYLSQLKIPWAVNKGDRVAIKAKIGQTFVATNGIAMQNGRIGEQISVRNEASKRMIRPWVWAQGTVGTRPAVDGGD